MRSLLKVVFQNPIYGNHRNDRVEILTRLCRFFLSKLSPSKGAGACALPRSFRAFERLPPRVDWTRSPSSRRNDRYLRIFAIAWRRLKGWNPPENEVAGSKNVGVTDDPLLLRRERSKPRAKGVLYLYSKPTIERASRSTLVHDSVSPPSNQTASALTTAIGASSLLTYDAG